MCFLQLEHVIRTFMFCMGKAMQKGLEGICMNVSKIPHCVKNTKNKWIWVKADLMEKWMAYPWKNFCSTIELFSGILSHFHHCGMKLSKYCLTHPRPLHILSVFVFFVLVPHTHTHPTPLLASGCVWQCMATSLKILTNLADELSSDV